MTLSRRTMQRGRKAVDTTDQKTNRGRGKDVASPKGFSAKVQTPAEPFSAARVTSKTAVALKKMLQVSQERNPQIVGTLPATSEPQSCTVCAKWYGL
jgi:hypothetical protein